MKWVSIIRFVLLKCKIRSTKFEIPGPDLACKEWVQCHTLSITKGTLACHNHVAPGQAESISKFEFSNYLNKVWILVIWNSDLFRVSIFEFRILIHSLERQKHSLDYVRKFWDTTLVGMQAGGCSAGCHKHHLISKPWVRHWGRKREGLFGNPSFLRGLFFKRRLSMKKNKFILTD